MPDGSRAQTKRSWTGVGVHPTPSNLVKGFARAVVAGVMKCRSPGSDLSVLDACAGDGRLGHAVSKRLVRLGYRVRLTLVETDAGRISSKSSHYEVEQVLGDFYAFDPQASFDVVVSNPPYLALGRVEAERLGFEWTHVLDSGRNLYGLALVKCLSISKPRGVVGLLAPHGWLRNWHGAGLRARVNRTVERVDVYASSSRRLFPGVHQDIAAQVFNLREEGTEGAAALVKISYDRSGFTEILLPARPTGPKRVVPKVRVGPFVWNREKGLLAARATGLPVVYGGNISSDGRLRQDVARYRGRQFLAKSRVPDGYVSRGPCLLIKRSLRGVPGNWKLDAVVVTNSTPFVAENHVIVIEFPERLSGEAMQQFCLNIMRYVEREHRHHGHPNVSVAIVRQALEFECELGTLEHAAALALNT
jgi:methylase of polypeptide subunit release factors